MSKASPSAELTPYIEKNLSFLFVEYGVLKDMYSGIGSGIQSLFNFYLTILSSIIGAVILILQISNSYSLKLGVVGGLLIFAIVIGIFHQWGIVEKYADLAHYAKAINEIKTKIVKVLPGTSSTIYEIPGVMESTRVNTNRSAIDRWEARLWWLFPINIHQLFIAFMNSICLAVLIWIPVLYARTGISNVWQVAAASFIVFWLSIIANDTYAKIQLQRGLSRNNRRISVEGNDPARDQGDR